METREITSEQEFKVCEVQISYRPNYKPSERPKITSSQDTYRILKASWDEGKLQFVEQFKVILLNRSNRVLGIVEVGLGGLNNTLADPKVIFAAALKASSSAIILAHNHPSGNLTPSQADINMTQKLCSGGNLLEISIYDHMIISSEGFYSFADEGLI